MSWTEGDVVVDGVRLHYTRTGGDKTPIVLAHGFSDNGLCWTRVARELESDYDVVMYDARGHGSSDAPDDGYGTDDHARDLAGLIAQLRLTQPAAMGHSMGAATVASVAGMDGVLSCAVLEDPGWRDAPVVPPAEGASREDASARAEAMRVRSDRMRTMSVDEIASEGRRQSPTWHADEFEAWALGKKQVSDKVRAATPARRRPWREVAGDLKVPTLLVACDMTRPGLVTAEAAAEAERIQPRVQAVQIPGTGHNIRRENFPAFMEAVRGFLEKAYASR